MTASYGSGDGSGQHRGEDADEGRAEQARPGPLPPRIEPHRPVVPAQPGTPAFPPAPPTTGYGSATPPSTGYGSAAPPATGYGSATPPSTAYGAVPPQPVGSGPATTVAGHGSVPAGFAAAPAPGFPPSAPGQPGQPAPPGQPRPAPPGEPWGGYPAPGTEAPSADPYAAGGARTTWSPPPAPQTPAAAPAYPGNPMGQPVSGPTYPVGQPGWPGAVPAAAAAPARRGWVPVTALALAAVLALVAGGQAWQLHRLGDRLTATDRRLADAQGADHTRFDGVEKRTAALEKQAGAAFNPEAVASAVLPSVFRVRAGQFTGTAFAIGKPVAGGGATMLTNFHVVESVWDAGGRQVFLERTDQRFPATIVKVDKAKDIAQLRTTSTFTPLVAAVAPVKSGQQIVVVGAPLGLQDSVTTGVVSAFRKDEGGSGPVIQFDAPINPGNSGGPVINGSKEVVGIATAKARDAEGIGLAIPIKTACDTFRVC
ncbi:trypsin-like peptidase domain-containing protein [Micromonospora sp. CCTCC AA 2012012]|uniref:Trypsin-like peptidase domain-containing protein n=1 Tax=Micromonospora sp. CCTCC AA 2012012 TaxID=3111921 RepID=A0AAU7M334_9ACTN